MSTLVICPSRGRPDQARELLASFEVTKRDPGSRLVFIVDADDPSREEYPREVTRILPAPGSMAGALRAVSSETDLIGTATSVGMVGDDCRFRTDGWDVAMDGWLTEHVGVAWPNDGWKHRWPLEEKASHWWLSRPVFDAFGLCPPFLNHLWMDDYWAKMANEARCAKVFPDILVEHLHPLAGKGHDDATYQRHKRHVSKDRAAWNDWLIRGKTADIAKLRRLIAPYERRRVLADWHHPALWESLSILFEDRLGFELYSPLGTEWTKHGWRFSHNGVEASDYLLHPDAKEKGDHFEIAGPEYPERPRKAVTWAQARTMSWDFVLASVSVHQRSFYLLAREFNARFLHQVGNARHPIDRSIKQTILASSTVEKGIRHPILRWHQPFDLHMFARTPISNRMRVQSLMLRLDATSCDYAWLEHAKDIEWRAVQSEGMGKPGYVAPMSRVAALMRNAGWIWHDKTIGDGYGHVMFNAAAMGRPLIGHASHFKGMTGGPLWRDLETCIDLDKHSPAEAVRLIRAISRDEEWQDEMSAAIERRFREIVDFDAETEAIRQALD